MSVKAGETARAAEFSGVAAAERGRGDGAAGPSPATCEVSFAVFGKLPQRRDFVEHRLPRPLLLAWEGFLQAGMAAARRTLTTEFEADYLVMPAWRFFLGAGCCEVAGLGVLVPSVDAMGRLFPLSILALAPQGAAFDLAAHERIEAGLALIEARLLSALRADMGAPCDLGALTAGLDPPPLACGEAARTDMGCRFWTAGHGGHRPARFVRCGLPSPSDFTAMVLGIAPADAPTHTAHRDDTTSSGLRLEAASAPDAPSEGRP
ncbi:type VI secretion-associated protein [Aurantimonas sp. 22II-16-19i]|nr:type VI secretion-associated protein [Aurantimonas sp. 22II-16-19i]